MSSPEQSPNVDTHGFYEQLRAEARAAGSPFEERAQLGLSSSVDTAIAILNRSDSDPDPVIVRWTNLDRTPEEFESHFQVHVFRGSELVQTVGAVALSRKYRLRSGFGFPDLPLAEADEDAKSLLENRAVVSMPAMLVSMLGSNAAVGFGDQALAVGGEDFEDGDLLTRSGKRFRILRRLGRESDGEELDDQEVREVIITDEETGETSRIVDLAHRIELDARAGGRFVLRHRGKAGAAVVVGVGAVAAVTRYGRSRFLRR